jgi:hypothetical protein
MIALITAGDVSTVLAAAAVLGAAFSVFRSTQLKSSLESMAGANDELRREIGDHERRREADRRTCDRELSEMRGQIQTLTGEFGRQIAMSIVEEWRKIEKPSTTTTTVHQTKTIEGNHP